MCTQPRGKSRPWPGEFLCLMGCWGPSSSRAGWSGCLLPLQQEEKGGERLCLEAGCSSLLDAPTELSVLGFCAASRLCPHFWMYLCFQQESHRSFLKERCSAQTDFGILAELLEASSPVLSDREPWESFVLWALTKGGGAVPVTGSL